MINFPWNNVLITCSRVHHHANTCFAHYNSAVLISCHHEIHHGLFELEMPVYYRLVHWSVFSWDMWKVPRALAVPVPWQFSALPSSKEAVLNRAESPSLVQEKRRQSTLLNIVFTWVCSAKYPVFFCFLIFLINPHQPFEYNKDFKNYNFPFHTTLILQLNSCIWGKIIEIN